MGDVGYCCYDCHIFFCLFHFLGLWIGGSVWLTNKKSWNIFFFSLIIRICLNPKYSADLKSMIEVESLISSWQLVGSSSCH